ncbi:MAG: M28 family peptidase [Bacteroidetes bacterium]|nr:M28 family peptidase [Bacteroidota bacterium]
MKKIVLLISLSFLSTVLYSQWNYYSQYGLIPEKQLDEIIGEASGEQAFKHLIEMSAYNRPRPLNEYATTLMESNYVISVLKGFGVENAHIERFGKTSTWKGLKGKLWEVSPKLRKIVDYDDLPLFLASGSNNADVTAELVWVGEGTKSELEQIDIKGKICFTSGSLGNLSAMLEKGALGAVTYENDRALIDPMQIPTSGMRVRGENANKGFAFRVTARDGWVLRDRLLRGEKIEVHAEVEATTVELDLQVPTCVIEGTDPDGEEIILSAHIFEGYVKQGANDNISGSAALLDVVRVLKTLYDENRLERPKRNIRFIWVPEFSGTIPWVNAHMDIMNRTLCNINMDMVGLKIADNLSAFNLHRTTMGNPHYINDVMACYFRYVGENNHERLTPVSRDPFLKPIVAPTGSEEPFYYNIEANNSASDHSVFNDWSVRVPGIMIITWPDPFYHSSNDRPQTCDPTQLKRVVFLGAATAYTIASANDETAMKIATEIQGNAMQRMGHQLTISSVQIANASKSDFEEVYINGIYNIDAVHQNEKETLESVSELFVDKATMNKYLNAQLLSLNQIYSSNLKVAEEQMKVRSVQISLSPIKLKPTALEINASKIIPVPTSKVSENGYRGYGKYISEVSKEIKDKYPYPSLMRSSGELNLLCNGKRTALEIKKMIDVQYPTKVDLEDVLNYIEILKQAGLVTYK